jgi:hypothetical protein
VWLQDSTKHVVRTLVFPRVKLQLHRLLLLPLVERHHPHPQLSSIVILVSSNAATTGNAIA